MNKLHIDVNVIHVGQVIEKLKLLPDKSVHMVVTSPPYWKLRDYGVKGQIGLEKTPELFIKKLVQVFREVYRVLRDDGTLWVNMGDSYANDRSIKNVKPKDLIGIPWILAFALRNDGWYLRQDIIWSKPNPMPESSTDRCTKSHEYLFLLTKSQRYFYDHVAIKTVSTTPTSKMPDGWDAGSGSHTSIHREGREKGAKVDADEPKNELANKRSVWSVAIYSFPEAHFATFPPMLIIDCIKAGTSEYGCCAKCGSPYYRQSTKLLKPGKKASFNSVIDDRDINSDKQDQGSNRMKDGHKPGHYNEHTTTGWEKKCKCDTTEIKPPIVLDPFFGAGTSGIVSGNLGRDFIGIDLSPAFTKIAVKRSQREFGAFDKTKVL